MALFQKVTLKTIVANSVEGAAETTFAAFKSSAANGEVIAVESDGTAIASGSKEIMILHKDKNGAVQATEPIQVANIKKVTAKAYSAGQEQIDYVGFNGTSGSIDVINSNLYQVNIEMANYGITGSENRYRKQGHFSSPASASELGVAEGLRDSLIRNFSREPEKRLQFDLVCSNAGTALNVSITNLTFTQGSKTVVTTGTQADIAVGDLLRVGTAVTDPVYRVTAIDNGSNLITLDQAFQGETVTVLDTAAEKVTAANIAGSDFGIKITGLAKSFINGKRRFEKMEFTTQLVDCGTTTVTKSQFASYGIGDGKRVAEEEWFTSGNYGELNRMGEPVLYEFRDVLEGVSTNKYDVVTIEYASKHDTAFQDNVLNRQINVYCNAGNGTDHTNANVLIADLDTLASVSVSTL